MYKQKIKNRGVIRRLAWREIQSNPKKNLMVILSIILTCILFTCVCSVGGSLLECSQKELMRQVGGKYMSGVKYVLPADYELIRQDKKVKDVAWRILVGDVVDERLRHITAEVNCCEEDMAENMFCLPTEGSMPVERNEIAVSTLVLDELGISPQLGQTIPLQIRIDGKLVKETFTLCGYWEGDPLAMAQQCLVSRSFCDEMAPTPKQSFLEGKGVNYSGYWMVDFNFANSWNIEKKTLDLLERCGYDADQISYGINWAYLASGVDTTTLAGVIVLLFITLFSGYLIIYNIFYIHVTANIRYFGLLKTIGTTKRQLGRMVRWQAMFYAMMGIPFGFLFGTLLSKPLLALIVQNLDMDGAVLSGNILIYILAAGFTLLTVWISCQKPCRFAASVTPIEALRYIGRAIREKKKGQKAEKVSALSLAKRQFSQSHKKAVVVVLSLSLSVILSDLIYTAVLGMDENTFVKNLVVGDFTIYDKGMDQTGSVTLNLGAVSQEDLEFFSSLDGVERLSKVYCWDEGRVQLEGEHYDRAKEVVENNPGWFGDDGTADLCTQQKEMFNTLYGINSSIIDQLELQSGKIDEKAFFQGGYALVVTNCVMSEDEDGPDRHIYKEGDSIRVQMPDGSVQEYQIMAAASVPYAISTKRYSIMEANVIIPEEDFLAHSESKGAMYAVLDVEEDKQDEVGSRLQEYVDTKNTDLVYVTRQTYLDQVDSYVHMFSTVGSTLCALLALIGILNFVNAISTGILARRREFAVMQAMGMTGTQLKTMLMWEGVFYAVFTLIFSLICSVLVSKVAVAAIVQEMFFFQYRFTLLPVAVCAPVLLVLSCLIPVAAYRKICQSSVVERLRVLE